ncbi:MAG: helix-turn-helix domain-containing protein [Chloroflexi bacterium]|nr:helix-turn-helix domain-containing protein [Chloroflexota bacterium]
MPLPRLLTVKEAAELLHVHVNTVRNWSNNGLLPAYRVGKRADRRFLRGDVLKLLRKSSHR